MLDNRCLKGQVAQLRQRQRHRAGLSLKLAVIATGPRALAALRALLLLCPAQPVGFRIQQRVQRLLDR